MILNTFSIIAVCTDTDEMGGSAASFFPALGAFTPYIDAGGCVIASQGWVNPFLRETVSKRIREGMSAPGALEEAIKSDMGAELRQISVIDANGRCAAHTGRDNPSKCGHVIGENYVITGNTLASMQVLHDMEQAFKCCNSTLEDKLLSALCAGDRAGGDARGKKASVLCVCGKNGVMRTELRKDDCENAVQELHKTYKKNSKAIIDRYWEITQRMKD